jgi:hypothetical protein
MKKQWKVITPVSAKVIQKVQQLRQQDGIQVSLGK